MLKACVNEGSDKYNVKEVYCSPTSKNFFHLDHYRGFFIRNQYDPHNSIIRCDLMLQSPMAELTWLATDEYKRGDYVFFEDISSQDRATIDTVIKANELCRDAIISSGSGSPILNIRIDMILEAAVVCPSHCPLHFLIMYENISNAAATNPKLRSAVGRVLKDAVEAGRKLVNLLQVNRFCEGNLFTYEPTRNYIRALYLRGSYLFRMGHLEEAYDVLQECLANDIHDKLGARHKQLLVVLEIGSAKRKYDKRLAVLLDAEFGDGQDVDDVLALWNYTRALHSFYEEGDTKNSRRILNRAIDKNPFVPALLLLYESENLSWAEHLRIMCIGKESEANDYVQDNRYHWRQTGRGSLEWLEEIYAEHNKSILPKINKAGIKLLSKGNKLFATRKSSDLKKAITKYTELLKITETKPEKYSTMQLLALERIGSCYKFLGDREEAMRYFNRALAHQDKVLQNNKDLHKEILYQVASCKEDMGDYQGALECYRTVFDKMGNFKVAFESVKRIEAIMGCKSGVIPAHMDIENPSDTEDKDKDMRDMIQKAFNSSPRAFHNTSNMDRCSQCKRGGIKLSICSLCKDDSAKYCSKACQKTSWRDIHKYICRESKFKINIGDSIIVTGLVKSQHMNGMSGKVVEYSAEKKKFVVTLSDTGSKILVKPQNIEIVNDDAKPPAC